MRKLYRVTPLVLILTGLMSQAALAQKSPKITLERITETCKDMPFDKRLTLRVERFSVSNTRAQEQGEFGGELATMLTNALQKTGCFRVLETNANGVDLTGDGLNAQLIVTGEVTEFSEKNMSVIGISKNKVNIGFILKVLNPQTGDILFSESVNGEGISSGFSSSVFTTSKLTGNVANACEQAIIKSAEILANQKDKIQAPVLQPAKTFSTSNCTLLRNGRGPKVMILIPETQTTGGVVVDRKMTRKEKEEAERKENREMLKSFIGAIGSRKGAAPASQTVDNNAKKTVVVDQATAEGVLINKFIEAGFRVVDPSMYSKMREQGQADDKAKMAALGLKLGADIVITGTANSEQTPSKQEGNFTFRGMVDLRALLTEDATIIATGNEISSADDRAESISAQKSIRNASAKMAMYMLEQLCSRNLTFASAASGPVKKVADTPGVNTTDVVITNTNYAKLKILADLLAKNPKVKSVQKNLKGTDGTLRIGHLGSTDELIDALGKSPTAQFDVKDLEEGKASLTMN